MLRSISELNLLPHAVEVSMGYILIGMFDFRRLASLACDMTVLMMTLPSHAKAPFAKQSATAIT